MTAHFETFVQKVVFETHNELTNQRITNIEKNFGSRLAFIEKIVFGFIGLICLAVMGAILSLVIIKGGK